MESEEARLQTNRERATPPVQYASVLSIPDQPSEIPDPQLVKSHMFNDIKYFKWSTVDQRPDNVQFYASYILLPQLYSTTGMAPDNLLQLEELKAALSLSVDCPFDDCKSGPFCQFKHGATA